MVCNMCTCSLWRVCIVLVPVCTKCTGTWYMCTEWGCTAEHWKKKCRKYVIVPITWMNDWCNVVKVPQCVQCLFNGVWHVASFENLPKQLVSATNCVAVERHCCNLPGLRTFFVLDPIGRTFAIAWCLTCFLVWTICWIFWFYCLKCCNPWTRPWKWNKMSSL